MNQPNPNELSEESIWVIYRSLVPSVYLPSFLMSMCQGSVLLMIPLFALDLGAGAGITALVFSLRGLGNMLVDVPAGVATSKFGDKTVMLFGVGLMSLSALMASQASTPIQLGIAAFSFGVAMSSWLLARLAHISEVVPVRQRGKAISTMAGIQRFGALVGPVASGFGAQLFGFEFVFFAITLLAASTALLIVFSVKYNRTSTAKTNHNLLRLVPNILSQHRRIFATAGTAIFCLTMLRVCRHLLVPLWGNQIGLDESEIGVAIGIAAGLDMLMFPIAGFVMDNFGRRYTAISCIGMLTIGLVLVPFSSSFFTLVIAITIAGIGNGLGSGINMTLGADFAPDNQRGEFLGVWRLISDSGSLIGPVSVGYIATILTLSSAFFAVGSMGLVGVIIMIFFVEETLKKPNH